MASTKSITKVMVGGKATHWMISSTISFLSLPLALLPLQVTIRFDHLEWHLMWSTCHGTLVCTKLPTLRWLPPLFCPHPFGPPFLKKTPLKRHFDATSHHTNLPSLQTQLIPNDPIPLGFILSNNKDQAPHSTKILTQLSCSFLVFLWGWNTDLVCWSQYHGRGWNWISIAKHFVLPSFLLRSGNKFSWKNTPHSHSHSPPPPPPSELVMQHSSCLLWTEHLPHHSHRTWLDVDELSFAHYFGQFHWLHYPKNRVWRFACDMPLQYVY